MGKPTRSAAEQNELYTTYAQEYLAHKLINQSFTNAPLFDKLLNRGRDVGGAVEIVIPVMDNYTSVGGWITRGTTVNVTHVDPFTNSRWTWAFRYEPAYLDWTDEQQTEGDGAELRYIEESLDNCMGRHYEGMATDLCAASTATNGYNSLVALIDSTGSIGNLNPATTGQSFWAAYETNSIGSFSANGVDELRRAFRTTSKYKGLGKVDIIACSKVAYDEYEKSGLALTTRTTNVGDGRADLGISELAYKGVPVIYEPHMDALESSLNGVMLGINSQHCKIVKKPGDAMKFSGWVDMLPGNKLGRAGTIKGAYQVVLYARAPHFKLTGITS